MRPRIRHRARALLLLAIAAAMAVTAWYWHSRWATVRPIEPPDTPRELTVDAPWFNPFSPRPTSGMSQVTIKVAPGSGSHPRVGFYETEANGAGDTWRATAWMATVAASLACGVDLGQYVPSFTVEGRIDGPSAGALLAVGLMAGLQGHELLPDATMTGAIGPDGTIGPVAGVVHKLEAAKRAGKRLLLIPRGQHHDISYYTNQPVDLVAYGRTIGIEVSEVDDLPAAYEALTGHKLRPVRSSRGQPDLPSHTQSALAERTSDWLALYADRMQACQRLCGELGGAVDIDEELAEARATADQARALAGAGAVAPAYDRAVAAALHAAVLQETLDSLTAVAARGLAPVRERLASVVAGDDRSHGLLTKIGGLPLSDLDAVLAVGDACGIVAQADGLRVAARQALDDLEEQADDASALGFLLKAAVIVALHNDVLGIAEDRLHFTTAGHTKDTTAPLNRDRLAAWAETLERAAEANLAYFEAVCLDESARGLGLHREVLRDSMACQDLTYLLARSTVAALPDLCAGLPDPGRGDVATLGASVGACAAASALSAKFYSLRVRMDDQGNVVGVEDEPGLERVLGLSDEKARAAIAAARDRRVKATLPTYYYLVGRAYAGGDALDKLEALQCYWQASLSARVAALLSEER